MYNNDYIIAVDENGQPYIAHANGEGNWLNKAVKYIKKEMGPDGKMRYYYNTAKRKAGTAAKMAWRSKAGRWIDSHDAGITERIMEKRLIRKGKKAYKSGNREDAMRYSRRANELRKEGRDEMRAAKENIAAKKKAAYDKTVGRAKDWLGYDEREARDKAYQALLNGSYNERTKAGKEHRLKETQDAYSKTLLGRYDKLKSQYQVAKYRRKHNK